jgi:hypothetical protein
MITKTKIIIGIIVLIGILAGASNIYNWYSGQKKPVVSQCAFTPAPKPKAAEKIKRTIIKVPPQIEVFDKEEVADKIDLPEEVKNDPGKQVAGICEVPPYEGKTNVEAILDTNTNPAKINMYMKQVPLSFFGFPNEGEIYFEGGINTKGKVELAGGGVWDFLRIEKSKIGFTGSLRGTDSDLMAFGGIRVTLWNW